MLKDDFRDAGLLPAPPTTQMEGQRPELIPYFHSSQGPAEAPFSVVLGPLFVCLPLPTGVLRFTASLTPAYPMHLTPWSAKA